MIKLLLLLGCKTASTLLSYLPILHELRELLLWDSVRVLDLLLLLLLRVAVLMLMDGVDGGRRVRLVFGRASMVGAVLMRSRRAACAHIRCNVLAVRHCIGAGSMVCGLVGGGG